MKEEDMTHPVEKHESLLSDLRKITDDHEARLRVLEIGSVQRIEQIKGLYENTGAIKILLSQFGEKLDKMSENIDAKLQAAVSDLDKRLRSLERVDGEKWKQAVGYVLIAVIAGVVGKFFI